MAADATGEAEFGSLRFQFDRSVKVVLRSSILLVMLLAGCGSLPPPYSFHFEDSEIVGEGPPPKDPASVVMAKGDITDRPYTPLRVIKITIRRNLPLLALPTEAQMEPMLREHAANLGADAVIKVRYSAVGITGLSWGSMTANRIAVLFVN